MAAPSYAAEDERWHKVWAAEEVPRFDAGRASPALVAALTDGRFNVAGARVVIPGCGRGYDVAAFVRAGAAHAEGVELVPAAAEAARAWLDSPEAGLDVEQRARAAVVVRDFFQPHTAPPADCGFDYTFFCAFPPARRPEWAAAWAAALRPGGTLVTLIFPDDGDANPGRVGPPWPSSPADVKAALAGAGFGALWLERVPDEASHPGRGGNEWLAAWRRGGAEEAAA